MFEWFSAGLAYSVAKDAFNALRGRRLTAAQKLELRKKWKPLFEERVWLRFKEDLRTDVIIRDMKRIDAYPNIKDNAKGISPWFRLGLAATYHRGIMVSHGLGMLTQSADGWRYTDYKAGEKGDLKVYSISNIAYDDIENVDWDGDEYYSFPHIYCYFRHRTEPYEYSAFYTRHEPPNGLPYYTEVAKAADVHKRSTRVGLKYFS